MPVIVRESSSPYKWSVGCANLSDVANVEKKMPRDFITADGVGITAKAREYFSPLIQGEDYPPYKNGLPQYARLQKILVPKKLPAWSGK